MSRIFVNSSRRRGGGAPVAHGNGIIYRGWSDGHVGRAEDGNSYYPQVGYGKPTDYGTNKYPDDTNNFTTVPVYNGATSSDSNESRGRGRGGSRGPGRGGDRGRGGYRGRGGERPFARGDLNLKIHQEEDVNSNIAGGALSDFGTRKELDTSNTMISAAPSNDAANSSVKNETRGRGRRGTGYSGRPISRGNGSGSIKNTRGGSRVDPVQVADSGAEKVTEYVKNSSEPANNVANSSESNVKSGRGRRGAGYSREPPISRGNGSGSMKNTRGGSHVAPVQVADSGTENGPEYVNNSSGPAISTESSGNRGRGQRKARRGGLANGGKAYPNGPVKGDEEISSQVGGGKPEDSGTKNDLDNVSKLISKPSHSVATKPESDETGVQGRGATRGRRRRERGSRGATSGTLVSQNNESANKNLTEEQNLPNVSQSKQDEDPRPQVPTSELITPANQTNTTADPPAVSISIEEVQETQAQKEVVLNNTKDLGKNEGVPEVHYERPERPKYSRVFYSSSHKRPFEPKRKKFWNRDTKTELPSATVKRDELELEVPVESPEEKSKDNVTVELPEPEAEPEVPLVTPSPKEPEPWDYNSVDDPGFQVFSNELVFDNLAKYLDHASLKALSETGKLLLEATRRCRLFVNNTQLNILNEDTHHKKNLVLLKSEFFPWTAVKLDVGKWKHNHVKIIQRVLSMESVESLELVIRQNEHMDLPDVKLMDRDSIVRLILSTQNLRSLTVDAQILDKIEHLFTPKLKRHLGSLSTFRIVSNGLQGPRRDAFIFMLHATPPNELKHLEKNLISLSTIEMKLRAFEYQLEEFETEDAPSVPLGIIERNQATLEELTLHKFLWKSEKLFKFRCPSLLSLDVRTEAQYASNLAQFIKNQPLLQKLKVHMEGSGTVKSFDLPDAIRMRSSKLRQLHVYWNLKTVQEPRVPFDWSFIEQLTYLEDLSIGQPPRRTLDQRTPLSEIIPKLPPTLKALKLNGGVYKIGIEDILLDSFHRLRNLTTLDLMHTTSVLNDASIQFICSRMTQLFELCIYKCDGVTDFGITGKQGNDADAEGYNLSNLKGLRKLKIIMCENVSYPAVCSVAKFLELKELHLAQLSDCHVGQSQLSPELIVEIAVQNPSLEVLRVTHALAVGNSLYPVDQLRSKIQESLSRFKTLEIERKFPEYDEDDVDFQMRLSFSDLDDDSPFDFSDFDMTEDESQEEWTTDSDDDLFGDFENVLPMLV